MENDLNQGPYKVRIFLQDSGNGNTLAQASAVINDSFAVKGIRIVKGKDGPFVSMPCYQTGDGKFHDICFPCTKEASTAFNAAVLHAYDQALVAHQDEITSKLAGPQMSM